MGPGGEARVAPSTDRRRIRIGGAAADWSDDREPGPGRFGRMIRVDLPAPMAIRGLRLAATGRPMELRGLTLRVEEPPDYGRNASLDQRRDARARIRSNLAPAGTDAGGAGRVHLQIRNDGPSREGDLYLLWRGEEQETWYYDGRRVVTEPGSAAIELLLPAASSFQGELPFAWSGSEPRELTLHAAFFERGRLGRTLGPESAVTLTLPPVTEAPGPDSGRAVLIGPAAAPGASGEGAQPSGAPGSGPA